MLGVAATIRHGYVPGSLLAARLHSSRQNRLTQAIQECGRIIKTISIHRRRVHTQLNKGESIHALRGEIHYANRGEIRRRDNEDQDLQGECLTLITNAVTCWNTVYGQAALTHLNHTRELPIGENPIARLSPTSHQHVNFLGCYEFSAPSGPPDGTLGPLPNNQPTPDRYATTPQTGN